MVSFIVLANGKRLADHNAADIETYLSDKGRDPDTIDSCFREIALALKILFVEVVVSEWALNFHWQKWLDTRDLPASHATTTLKNTATILTQEVRRLLKHTARPAN